MKKVTAETLTAEVVRELARNAAVAGDVQTIADCRLWLDLPFPLLSEPGLDAAERIAAVLAECSEEES